MSAGTMHVLYWLRAEGVPRLALSLLDEERARLGTIGSIAVCTTTQADLLPEVVERGIEVIDLQWRPHHYRQLTRRITAELARLGSPAVVCYSLGPHISASLAARRAELPCVVHLGNSPPQDRSARMKLRLQMFAGRPFVNWYAACSDYVRDSSIRAYGLPTDRVVTIYNGIDVDDFQGLHDGRLLSGSSIRVGMVGTFEAHKRQDILIRALAADDDARLSLSLVGAGSRAAELHALSESLGVGNRVEWIEPPVDVRRFLSRWDVFAYAVGPEEGLGIALVEALAAGLPIVASDEQACREVLDGGRLGTLVDGDDPARWSSALRAAGVATRPGPADLNRFDIRETAARYLRLLERI